ncbi:PEP-CTERM sorting domain-containing protein [Nitrosomonas ureae]|uniref:PEP-CTERM protein-sorting domain-containing protein n=1 Tax=Nitrosomonas ureae TaxID=44577 RepID=A0A286A4N7_9PROT|nr:PEP-CTERM sorting domain-containing protein [Nitrosomonas ureae]PTQ81214.1 putative secreted protein with PEP-CTERM sorting signal [Nitrosomonas ureae]SOD16885.1 PEP-CTERM protein-sorting domain-containing protein [Nitrosomonas ureae]
MRIISMMSLLALMSGPVAAASWQIGDNDGYGAGICDNCQHSFNGFTANYDGRSAAEMVATDGTQYTDTYSTAQPGFSPHGSETVATFSFTGLGNSWAVGHLEIDMADFQASTFGSVITTFNGITQNFAYNDGFPNTLIHFYTLTGSVIDSINATGELVITIDRNNSTDFYGFDYLKLSDIAAPVPEPETYAMLLVGLGLLGFASRRRMQKTVA